MGREQFQACGLKLPQRTSQLAVEVRGGQRIERAGNPGPGPTFQFCGDDHAVQHGVRGDHIGPEVAQGVAQGLNLAGHGIDQQARNPAAQCGAVPYQTGQGLTAGDVLVVGKISTDALDLEGLELFRRTGQAEPADLVVCFQQALSHPHKGIDVAPFCRACQENSRHNSPRCPHYHIAAMSATRA
ncbi:MAG: hypothetical protein HPKKFMNG_00092 [Planctomycetes bacterium]|nr:hypothetical protein [Planctomycetota bacterium]